ncbi:nucleoporin 62 like isoform X1 [Scyliorhinus canicula]|uniref:nucleoporin 62 like isoform X1 n=1 Tax=Scyliorhinus canicula TaxID=7830 RepID=UPI0018F5A733|nr:nucleoporin 62 like isoform X1 [Scyliorhinus canicula]
MSFNFGSPAGGSGFPFTAPKTAATTTPGFSFGSNTAAPQGGFGFGAAQLAPGASTSAPSASSLFSFSTPSTAATPSTGFCLPTQPAATAATSAAGGFSLGANKTNLGFGGAVTQPISGFSFGNVPAANTSTTASCPPMSSGSIAQTTAPASFSFGANTAQPTTGGFGLNSACSTVPTTASTGFGFTSTPAASTQSTAAGGFSFGTAANGTPALAGFSFGTLATPAAPKTAAAVPSLAVQPAGFAFGPVTSAPAATTSAPATQGFSFGAKAAAAPTATPAAGPTLFASMVSSVPPATSVTTSFSLASSAAPVAAVPATSTTSAPFGFKPTSATVPVTTATPLASTSATAAMTNTGFSLGLKTPASFSLTPGPAVTTAGVSTTTALPTAAVGTTAATITTTSAAPTTGSAPPVMSYAQLESLINKWSVELEDQEKQFLHQATQVNAWDRMLIENGEKITALHREAEKVKLDQKRLDQELDFILSQQKELEDLLVPLEQSVRDQHGTIYLQHADEEREHTYKLAENIDAQLKRMAQDLKEIIQHLNTTSGSSEVSDPLQQICKILNAHMDSLQWIDQSSVLLQKKVEDVSKQFEMRRREQERNCRITFD